MAKRLIDWEIKGQDLVMGKYVGPEEPSEPLASFPLEDLFPQYRKYNEVQRFIIVYGLKQKLADCGAGTTDIEEKANLAKAKFEDFKEGKLTIVRVSANKEDKRIAKEVKSAMEAVSLEGLILKKTLKSNEFTEEDQKKLDEFLALKVEMEKKINSKK